MRFASTAIAIALALAACSKAPEPPAADSTAAAPTEAAPDVAAEIAAAPTPEAVFAAEATADAADPITDRIWLLSPDEGKTGAMMLFLSDGVMMQGSCGETYRLSQWRRDEAGKIAWSEDGTEITADVIAVDGGMLTIGVNLRTERKVESFKPAAAAFVCPDLPR